MNLAVSMYDFGVTQGGDAFAVPRQGGYVARMLRGGRPALRPELASALFAGEGTAPNGSALADAMAVLEGQAQQADPVHLALRTARHEGALLLDLGDLTGRVVAVTPDGWEIIDRSPVLFRRTAATLPLPDPVRGQDLRAGRRTRPGSGYGSSGTAASWNPPPASGSPKRSGPRRVSPTPSSGYLPQSRQQKRENQLHQLHSYTAMRRPARTPDRRM